MDIYQKYTRRADQAANRLSPVRGQLDVCGRDQDDYRQMLLVKAVEAHNQFCEDPAQPNSRERWVGVALYNQRVSYLRDLARTNQDHRPVALHEDVTEGDSGHCLERRVVARDLLRRVADKLTPGEWELLVVSSECGVKEAWREMASACPYDTFKRRVSRARQRAQKTLKKLVPELRGGAS